ncbi:hypothetical protein BDQ17DRAFT_1001165 [Cyathus striatus]|nr:hypothetical protein BDQ17DRAFT_1001165 [Cyathus striatus]
MSPQRVADAARISPFTDSQESQQGRSTASGSENADSSQSRHKKAVKKPPRDRNGRQGQEEEMRFNIGPPSTRSINSSRGRRSTRAGRQDRLHSDGRNDIDVPNYPPPSFQEAISSSALSIYPSTTTLYRPRFPMSLQKYWMRLRSNLRYPYLTHNNYLKLQYLGS